MKDRSRLLSSVIVSLLAGFIYYQFGDNIQSKINSFKAVISYNDTEVYGPEHCQSFNSIVNKTDVKLNKKSKFYVKKRNTVEFKKDNVTIPGDEMLSGLIKQASYKKPTPDKNIDFSAELNNLINSSSNKKVDKDFKVDWKQDKKNEVVADNKVAKSDILMMIKGLGAFDKEAEFDENTGYGFEYNYTIDEETGEVNGQKTKLKIKAPKIINKSECIGKCECNSKVQTNELRVEKRIKVGLPTIKVKIIDESFEIDLPEINIEGEPSEEDPM